MRGAPSPFGGGKRKGGIVVRVSELVAQLSAQSPDDLVVISADSEGNHFSPVAQITSAEYRGNTPFSGDIATEDDDDFRGVNAVVLWPVV
jgi:hypothetical protein